MVITDSHRDAYARILSAYRHEDVDELPVVVMDANYWLWGEDPDRIPDDYFTDSQSQVRFQIEKIRRHRERFRDDTIPMLFPWFGTGVVPSALGCRTVAQPKMDLVAEGGIVTDPAQVAELQRPDPERDGLMPRVLECIAQMKAHGDLPVSFTDCARAR